MWVLSHGTSVMVSALPSPSAVIALIQSWVNSPAKNLLSKLAGSLVGESRSGSYR